MPRGNDSPGITPVPAASIAVFRENSVLLAKRGRGHLKGLWSLPGGHIEPGEKARDAALRELTEETGVTARGVKHLTCHDMILRDSHGMLSAHYVLNVYYGHWEAGQAKAASDIIDVCWAAPEILSQFSLTPGAKDLIFTAWNLILKQGRHNEK